jgi:glycosyltransferase involved in cell wall biosynthesis
MIRISLVVPAYNEEKYLPDLLDSVEEARERFTLGPSLIEVIIADNGSTDNTAVIADQRRCLIVHEERRIIAAVRNTGARVAQGEILAFTDADNIIHHETFNQIEKALSSSKIVGGSTGVRLERMSLGIASAYAIMVPMVWATGMDTGVIFCRRRDFEDIGGYNENHLFAEDVQFLWKLIKHGRIRGQRLVRIRKCKAITSTRKFDQFGDWHYICLIFKFFFSLIIPKYTLESFAQKYWYSDERQVSKKTSSPSDYSI